jgi:hypothetical protein
VFGSTSLFPFSLSTIYLFIPIYHLPIISIATSLRVSSRTNLFCAPMKEPWREGDGFTRWQLKITYTQSFIICKSSLSASSVEKWQHPKTIGKDSRHSASFLWLNDLVKCGSPASGCGLQRGQDDSAGPPTPLTVGAHDEYGPLTCCRLPVWHAHS